MSDECCPTCGVRWDAHGTACIPLDQSRDAAFRKRAAAVILDLEKRLAAAAKRIRELEEAARPFSYSKQYTPDWKTWDRLRRVLGMEEPTPPYDLDAEREQDRR